MNIVGIVLLLIAAAGMGAFGLRFARHGPFIDYHQKIIDQNGGATAGTTQVIIALYRVLGGAVLALAFVFFVLVLGPIMDGALWAKVALVVASLTVGIPAALIPLRVEKATGVRTPWRASVALICVSIVGVLLTFV